MGFYTYSGRTFATIAAAKAYHDMRDYFSGRGRQNEKQPQKWHVQPTTTFTKEKQETSMEDNPQGLKQNFCRVRTGLPRLKGMLHGNITYRDQHYTNIGSSGDKQTHQIVSYIGTASQWLTSTNNATASNRDSVSYGAWSQLNVTAGVASTALVTAQTNPTVDKMGLSYATVYMDFINRSTAPCFIKVMYFVAKQDTNEDCLDCYSTQLTGSAWYTSNYTIGAAGTVPSASGNEVVSYTAATTSSSAFMTSVPYTNLLSKRNVKSTWRILKTKTFVLAAADTHRLTTNMTINQFCIKERMNSAGIAYPKGCVATVVALQGAASIDTASQLVILGAPSVGVVTTRKVQLCPMKVPNARFDNTYVGAGTIPVGTALANTEQITEALANAATFET